MNKGNAWASLELGEICKLRGGSAFKPALQGRKVGEFPFIKVSDFNSPGNEARINGAKNWVDVADRSTIQGQPFPAGATVFAKIGEALKHNRKRVLTRPTYIDNNLMGAVAKSEIIHPEFLFQLFRTIDIAASDVGTAVPYVKASTLEKIPVAVPPLEAQRQIASILGAYDALIEVNRRRIEVLEEMTRGLFEEWFVRFRFPGHEAVPIVNTPDGPLPEGWRNDTLGDVATINAASLRPANAPSEIGYIDISSVSPGRIDIINHMSFAEAPGRARRIVTDGSVLWSNVRPNRRSFAVVLDPTPEIVASTGFTVLDARETSFAYLYHWVTTDNFVGYLVGNAQGAAYPAVTAATFERAAILLPPADLVKRFTDFAEPMLRLADRLRKTNGSLAASRDLLLPRLISGQLSIAQAERQLEETA